MNIKFDEEVIKYMSKKNKSSIMVTMVKSGGGWCGSLSIPDLELRAPEELKNYIKYTENGIDVYLHKNVKVTAPVIRFRLNKIFFVSTIYIEGIKQSGM